MARGAAGGTKADAEAGAKTEAAPAPKKAE
jgi:hypothetical protein